MLIAQITDLHIRAKGARAYGGEIDTAERLAQAIDFINSFDPRPDLVLATGDLIDLGRPEEYTHLRELLDRLVVPYHVIPGNHDHRDHMRAAFADHAYLPRQGFLHYTIEDHPIRLIGLDTMDPGKTGGLMCEARTAWLAARLDEQPQRPTVIFMHHPVHDTGIIEMDGIRCEGAEAMGAVVKRHDNIERILCGHLHRATIMRWYGTVSASMPATAPEVALTIDGRGLHGWRPAPPHVGMHLWRPGIGLISHFVAVTGERVRKFAY